MNVKQVIVIRKDLKMRRGKEIAQGSHASMAFLTRRLREIDCTTPSGGFYSGYFTAPEILWIKGKFTKVCLQVDSEEELLNIYKEAQAEGLECNLITDVGLTEFNGVPTNTCLAIGPDYSEKIDSITKKLKLY